MKANIRVGDLVRFWDGSGCGRVQAITPDGWYAVKDSYTDCVSEWQAFQLTIIGRAVMTPTGPEFYVSR